MQIFSSQLQNLIQFFTKVDVSVLPSIDEIEITNFTLIDDEVKAI